MKSWKKIALLVGVLGVAGAAVAAGAHHARGAFLKNRIDARVNAALDAIEATPQQRQLALQAETDIVNAIQAKHQANRGAHQALLQAFTADQFDAQAFQTFADARTKDVKDLASAIIPSLQKVHDSLSPEQRAKLVEFVQQHRHHGEPPGGFGGQ
jgi:Spy/CpxP family protein refolding chaperone